MSDAGRGTGLFAGLTPLTGGDKYSVGSVLPAAEGHLSHCSPRLAGELQMSK